MKKNNYIVSSLAVLTFFAFVSNAMTKEKSLKATKSLQIRRGITNGAVPDVPLVSSSVVPEVEPNNGITTAQPISPPSPSTIEGTAEVADEGEIGVTFQNGQSDDFEDVFEVILNSTIVTITLTGTQSDLDLWLFDADSAILAASTQIGVTNESITDTLDAAGTYYIGVSIFDEDPVGPSTSNYTLTVTGDIGTPTRVDERADAEIPTTYGLGENYPNPFNPSTKINYDLPEAGQVLLKVYNAIGQEIVTLVDEIVPRGAYVATWDGRDAQGVAVSSGVYFYTLQAGSFTQTRKMLLMK